MKFNNRGSSLYFPTNIVDLQSMSHITDMSIVAHQDDLELIGYPGIHRCFKKKDKWFGGIVCTNGVPEFSNSIDKIRKTRNMEQKKAAEIGEYGLVFQLDYFSKEIKGDRNLNIESDIKKVIEETTPETIYTHNPFDRHMTHLAVCRSVINGIRSVKKELRPNKLYGCEVWGNLDWLTKEDRVEFDVGGTIELAGRLINVFNSQIKNGKNYERASIGRRSANATFSDPYKNDISDQIILGVDLSPLIVDEDLDIEKYLIGFADRFRKDIENRISKIANK